MVLCTPFDVCAQTSHKMKVNVITMIK